MNAPAEDFPPQKNKPNPSHPPTKNHGLRMLLEMVFRFPGLLFIISLLGLLSSIAAAPIPWLAKVLIDEVLFPKFPLPTSHPPFLGHSPQLWAVLALVALGITLKLLSATLSSWQCHYILLITRNCLYDLRLDTALCLTGARQDLIDTLEPGRIASRLGLDVNNIDGAVFMLLRTFFSSAFTVLVVAGFMLALNPLLTLVVLATMPITAYLSVSFFRKLHQFNQEESDRLANLNATVTETFHALRLIRLFAAEPYFLERIRACSEALRFEGIRHWTRFHAISQLLSLLGSIGADVFLLVGGVLALSGSISFGQFFAFYTYQSLLWAPLGLLLTAGQFFQSGTASAEKIHELHQLKPEPYLCKPPELWLKSPSTFLPRIEAHNLSFRYPNGDPILRNLNFVIPEGTTTALVGHSGSGKTTLSNLLSGILLPTEGDLLISNQSIFDWNLRQLRMHIGVVLQDNPTFHGTVLENLQMGQIYPENQIWAALRAAHLEETVRNFPNGLHEPLGPKGTRLSGGQKQRLAIARVFLKNPQIVIFDEATSALDSETERAIQRSFDALMAGRTCIVIAHRLSTVVNAHQIFVMHQGKIVETGTHKQLLAKHQGKYRELYQAQVEGMIDISST